ncbi:MAG: hypothetical protein IBJ03_15590 [Gemmatimonadaceae bacterium]|nr:hypothetical protein [Gemmatimonadaceae bacterium]
MLPTRREFLGQLTASAGMLGMAPLSLDHAAAAFEADTQPALNEKWDLSWTKKLTTRYRVVFDVPEIENGYGVWRATLWRNEYQQTLGVQPKDTSTVLVLRHNAIVLAMNQAFWDKYKIGKLRDVKHPWTEQPTDRNVALLSSKRKEQPAEFDSFALDQFMARGGIALACNRAFGDLVAMVASQDKVNDTEARKRATSMIVPGVIMQPSGVFAALHAQDFGCKYFRAT